MAQESRLRIQIIDQPFKMGRDLYIVQDVLHGRSSIALPLTMREIDPVASSESPTLHIPYQDDGVLQSLMDQLWRQGFRPLGSITDTEAMERHLSDMRVIVEEQLMITFD